MLTSILMIIVFIPFVAIDNNYLGRKAPSLKMARFVCLFVFSYYFCWGRLPVFMLLIGVPPICHQRHLAKNGHEDQRL